ncbi:MAG: hypothetical protein ACRDXB_06125, partial [Actinomycetes bacterium]
VRTGVRVAAAAATGLAFAAGTGMAAAQSDDPFHPIRDIFEWGLRIGEGAASPSREADHGAARNLEPRPHSGSAEPRTVAARAIGTENRPRAHADGDRASAARHPRHSRGGGRDELAHAHDRDHQAHPSGPGSRDDHGAEHRGPRPGHHEDSPGRGSEDETSQDGTEPERPSPSTRSDPR